ncbi:hypothetical protein KQX54_000259 [Cotesia glomerata]|uniref:Uncharacterized protein n=1 Tax=Cotesia glomerata TaxID=32391 RepID=A0AAV7I434_COTGL|nr:hypothetical protein KQX54_000259 [Cotesia glomerata]
MYNFLNKHLISNNTSRATRDAGSRIHATTAANGEELRREQASIPRVSFREPRLGDVFLWFLSAHIKALKLGAYIEWFEANFPFQLLPKTLTLLTLSTKFPASFVCSESNQDLLSPRMLSHRL